MGSCCRTLSVAKKASNRVWWTALLMRIRSYGTMCRSTTSNHSWQRPSEVVNKFTCRQWGYSGRQSATWNRSQRPASEWQRPSSGDKQSNDNNDSYKVNAKVNGGVNAKNVTSAVFAAFYASFGTKNIVNAQGWHVFPAPLFYRVVNTVLRKPPILGKIYKGIVFEVALK